MKDVDRQSGAVPVEARLNSGGCRIADGDLVVDDSTVLGSGGSGTVTTGMWLGTTKVAVKKLNAASDATEDEISEMYDEMFLLSKLHHPNIVTFYGYSHSAGSLCIVTEYVAGGDLSAYIFDTLRHPAYTLGHTLAVAKSICAGMIYLDSQKVVHRDLKPGNVLVTDWAAGAVKICDFGLSEMLVRRGLLAKSVFSTPAYSAPEISRSEHTGKVDVYSFGIVLWEMAARRHAWEDYKFAVDIERDVANGMRPDMPPAEGVPAWYCDLVKKCWDPVPYSRPSFREIFDTISAHQDDLH